MKAVAYFQNNLLTWYQQHGRKNLPWQNDPNAYRVWVSEIMLQQTQVSTVIPYYQKFIHQFSTIVDLAKAPLDDVLKLWEGLGYYSRARNLHRCAKIILEQYQGQFPSDLKQLMTLPGIGRSTAGAILSFAFLKRAPILDGNVKRILIRFHAIQSDINNTLTVKKLWKLSERYTPQKNIRAYTQAIMDLGSLICTRTNPRCLQCPIKNQCKAFLSQRQTILPLKKIAKSVPSLKKFFLILQNDQHEILLIKRPPVGIWSGLWSFPEIDQQDDLQFFCQQQLGYTIKHSRTLKPFSHRLTHLQLEIHPIILKINTNTNSLMESPDRLWHNIKRELVVAMPKPIHKIIAVLLMEIS